VGRYNKVIKKLQRMWRGFTIVELLITIATIAIIATIVGVVYANIQLSAQSYSRKEDIISIQERLESYAAKNDGLYPATTSNPSSNWHTIDVRTDDSCFNGSSQTDWIPGFDNLQQSIPNVGVGVGVDGNSGCYLYASNGEEYVLSAWNMLADPQTDSQLYRRLGFRPFQTATSTQFYTCNNNVVGGANGGYDIEDDYYKHSYTVSNIETCDETPPPGA
jgi:prepilin-type N-terminal cleavage/methylation domain-containing protein